MLKHPYFRRDVVPLQIFNKATDGFLPKVKPHLFKTLTLLDKEGLKNDVLLITRFKVSKEDCDFLNSLNNLCITILITYSGIENKYIEPIDNKIPIESMKVAYKESSKYRVVLYWRPIIPGFNDSDEQIDFVLNDLSKHAHAVVFTGLFYSEQVRKFFIDNKLPHLASDFARRKIFPKELEDRILSHSINSIANNKLFRKTSCAVSFVHDKPDYNGHYGISNSVTRPICNICPSAQLDRCASNHNSPSRQEIENMARLINHQDLKFTIKPDKYVIVEHMDSESVRYFLQHNFHFQFHDEKYAHKLSHHGRADIGWKDESD